MTFLRTNTRMKCTFNEIHFVHLASQSNIYGFSWLRTVEAVNSVKLLAASLKKPIICLEFNNKPFENLHPASKELHFTYIPGGAEIISIDSFNKSLDSNDFTIGITFNKEKVKDDQPAAYYLNIYTEWEPKSIMSLESISQSCLSLELKFIPYKLYHTTMPNDATVEMVWLLSGNDEEVHLFRETKGHTYAEQDIANYFPEFFEIKSIVLCMDIVNVEGMRLTAFGCENGYIRASIVDTLEIKCEREFSVKHDSPISCVKLFKWKTKVQPPSFMREKMDMKADKSGAISEIEDYHLLVVSTLEVAVVYWRVLSGEPTHQKILPGSDQFDSVQCACVADVDMDGVNEIVVGTYGQQLLLYKCVEVLDLPTVSKSSPSPRNSRQTAGREHFTLVWQRKFANPILAVDYIDVTGDGLKELVVLSTRGLHVLQHNLENVCQVLSRRLEQFVNDLPIKSAFHDDQGEDSEDDDEEEEDGSTI